MQSSAPARMHAGRLPSELYRIAFQIVYKRLKCRHMLLRSSLACSMRTDCTAAPRPNAPWRHCHRDSKPRTGTDTVRCSCRARNGCEHWHGGRPHVSAYPNVCSPNSCQFDQTACLHVLSASAVQYYSFGTHVTCSGAHASGRVAQNRSTYHKSDTHGGCFTEPRRCPTAHARCAAVKADAVSTECYLCVDGDRMPIWQGTRGKEHDESGVFKACKPAGTAVSCADGVFLSPIEIVRGQSF
jgi:hypothetical protein